MLLTTTGNRVLNVHHKWETNNKMGREVWAFYLAVGTEGCWNGAIGGQSDFYGWLFGIWEGLFDLLYYSEL